MLISIFSRYLLLSVQLDLNLPRKMLLKQYIDIILYKWDMLSSKILKKWIKLANACMQSLITKIFYQISMRIIREVALDNSLFQCHARYSTLALVASWQRAKLPKNWESIPVSFYRSALSCRIKKRSWKIKDWKTGHTEYIQLVV